ncbi:MAG: adenosylcobinamide-GDP ribazoletransferase [Clostridia bacterium]|nr:adenosylcobinamide-GDP ribazoletransferase [Clostridia bacterium]
MKKAWHAFWMCFGMFCGVPCPLRVWDEAARGAMIACLPLVGGVIGGLWALALWLCRLLALPAGVGAAILCAAPWLLSGCIHLDGYLDCCDAVFSRRDLKKRREILKDPHTGSFAVIGMALLAMAGYGLWRSAGACAYLPLILLPVVTRACAAVAVACLKPMDTSQYAGAFQQVRRWGRLILPLLCLALGVILPAVLQGRGGLAPLAGACGYWVAVWYGTRQLGGVSGDVSGFALTLGELAGVAALTLL